MISKKFKEVKFDAIGLALFKVVRLLTKLKTISKYIVVAKIENIIGVKNVNKYAKLLIQ